jgi:phospholipid/cholesterol/gamma-HCH transport system permease protein
MDLGGVARLTAVSFMRLFRRPFEFRLMVRELDTIGWQSSGVVGILGLFIGMVLVVNTGETMAELGMAELVSEGVALAMVREFGPVLAGFLIAGRIGSGIAAEIGSMQISEQIDAMRSLGADPIKKLVLPKVMAAIIALPLLTTLANILGIFGGMIMAETMLNISPQKYMTRVLDILTVADFAVGVLKTTVFGLIIAMVGCHFGFRTTGGTVGVGKSATRSVVMGCILVLLADLVIVSGLYAIGGILTT